MDFLRSVFVTLFGAHEVKPVKNSEGFIVFFMGLLVIFAVLTILILFFMTLKLLNGSGKKSQKAQAPKTPVIEVAPQPTVVVENDDEIVAAITAAISCVLSAETKSGEVTPFVIKKIRHI